jgi:hypothetical protein
VGVHAVSISSTTILNSPIVTTAETVICTTGPFGLPVDNALVIVMWYAIITLTAGSTAITMRLRRGNALTSAVVNVPTAQAVTASTVIQLSGTYVDTPGIVAGLQYSLTAQLTAAGANSTPNDICLTAIAL